MSMRGNPSKTATTFLDRLVKTMEIHQHVSSAEEITKINQIIGGLKGTVAKHKQWDEKLLNLFLDLDHHRRKIKGADFSSILQDLAKIDELLHNYTGQSQNDNCFKPLSPLEQKIIEEADKNPMVKSLRVSYGMLDSLELRICLLFLAIFPESATLKKRLLIYWWIGEGLVRNEAEGEKIFKILLEVELIIPHRTDKRPPVSKCRIHPWIRYMLISEGIKQKLLHIDEDKIPRFNFPGSLRACLTADFASLAKESKINAALTIFNVSERYLSLKPDWLAELKELRVLQLGRWQHFAAHHIEVLDESWQKGLGTQKHLKYLSLRGISRITQLPPSIVDLTSLEILDLHACHNLEKLPDDIASLKKLTHLDVSKCYLLESMPKGLEKLTSLQVLKGFIIGNSKETPCRIEHLRNLKRLERLTIHIGSEAAVIENKGFDKLKDLTNVKCLKISWAVVRKDNNEKLDLPKETLTFPPSLEKLDLEGIPHEWMKDLRPSQLKQLRKLYIKGGELGSLYHNEKDKWSVKILIFKYTKNLKIDLHRTKQMFPSLKYVKKVTGRKEDRQVDMFETSGEESDCEWVAS